MMTWRAAGTPARRSTSGRVASPEDIYQTVFDAIMADLNRDIGAARQRHENLQFPIPFGVFLGLATLAVIFFGNTLFTWYRSLLGS